jgi:hypothetical protein
VRFADAINNKKLFLRSKTTGAGQTNTIAIQSLSHTPPDAFIIMKNGLRMQRFPYGTGLYIGFAQKSNKVRLAHTKCSLIDKETA